MQFTETLNLDASPYAGYKAPPEPKILDTQSQPKATIVPSNSPEANLDTLDRGSSAHKEMVGASLDARSGIMRVGKDDKGFPVSLKMGVESRNYPSTFGGKPFTTNVTPSIETGQAKLGEAYATWDTTGDALQSVRNRVTQYEIQYVKANDMLTTLWAPVWQNVEQYLQRTGNNYYEEINKAWYNSGISSYWDGSKNVFIANDPKYTEIVAVENKNQAYYATYEEQIILANQLRSDAENALGKGTNNISWLMEQLSKLEKQFAITENERRKAFENKFFYSLDFEAKAGEYQKVFGEIFHKSYSRSEVVVHYKNAMNSYGSVLEKANPLNLGDLFGENAGALVGDKETEFKKTIIAAGSTLTPEEKIMFINLLGRELLNRTYNNKAYKEKMAPKTPSLLEQFQNLAQASFENQDSPMSVCTGIHATVAQVAKLWNIPTGMVTVGLPNSGHTIAVMKIGDRTVFSDYGRVTTGRNIEEALDSYALSNQSLVFTNYLADENGNIIGSIRTPLNKHLDAQMFSLRDITAWAKNPSSMPEGLDIEITNMGKSVTLNNRFMGNFYSQLGLRESSFGPIRLQTVSTTLGYEGGDKSLRYFLEGGFSKTRADMNRTIGDVRAFELQGGVKRLLEVTKNLTIGTTGSARIKAQTSGGSDNPTGIWGGEQGAEISATLGTSAKLQANDTTSFSAGVSHTRAGAPNLQLDITNVRDTFGTTTIHEGIEYITEKGTAVSTEISKTTSGLADIVRADISLKGKDLSASAYYEQLQGKHTLGPSDTRTIGVQVSQKIKSFKNGEWYAGVRQEEIANLPKNTSVNAGVKFNF